MSKLANGLIGLSMLFNAGAAYAGDAVKIDPTGLKNWDVANRLLHGGQNNQPEIPNLSFSKLSLAEGEVMPAYTCIDKNQDGVITPSPSANERAVRENFLFKGADPDLLKTDPEEFERQDKEIIDQEFKKMEDLQVAISAGETDEPQNGNNYRGMIIQRPGIDKTEWVDVDKYRQKRSNPHGKSAGDINRNVVIDLLAQYEISWAIAYNHDDTKPIALIVSKDGEPHIANSIPRYNKGKVSYRFGPCPALDN